MKIELSFAKTSLAIVCLLLLVGYLTYPAPFNVWRVANQTTINTELSTSTGAVVGTTTEVTDLDGQQLLNQSAQHLFNSPPFQAAAQLSIDLFQQQIVTAGLYSQMGQGSRLARLEFVFDEKPHPFTVLQICDERYFYRYEDSGGEPSLRLADLSRVAQADQHFLLASSKTWMATGGLSSLIENLATNFRFGKVELTTLGQTPVYRITGSWKEQRLRRLLHRQVNHAVIKDKIDWQRLPPQIPHSVEVILGNDDFFPLFPYRVSFFRKQPTEKGMTMKKIVTMELHEVEKMPAIEGDLFRVESQQMQLNDITKQVVQRIQNLNQDARSAEQRRSTYKQR